MPNERLTCVDISPELEMKVSNNPEALVCLAGLAYLSAIIIDEMKFPDFKQSLSMCMIDFYASANQLKEEDFASTEERETVFETSRTWSSIGMESWIDMGVIDYNNVHTKFNLKRLARHEKRFTMSIGPFGK